MALRLTSDAPFFPEILSLHARWRGTQPAIVCDEIALSWAEFDAAANRRANAFNKAGLKPGDAIALAMTNSADMVLAIAAAMKAGLVTAPLNVSVRPAAMLSMIADAGARAIIASPELAAPLEAAGSSSDLPKLKLLDRPGPDGWHVLADWAEAAEDGPPSYRARRDDPLNIIYSSGTTGQPKGILHTHGTRLDWAYDLAIALRYHSGARTLVTLGLYSNISWVMMLCTWLAGGTLFIRSGFSAADVQEQVRRHRITHTAMVPVQYQRILDDPGFDARAFDTLQYVMSCGSPLLAHTKSAWLEICPGVIELYGLTEGLITTLDPEDAPGRLASVGKPLPGTDIRILDEQDRDCPTGQPGEIVGRGRIAMPFYHNRPEATQAASWTDKNGQVWLRTGDIGQLDADGFLYIVDRKKDMIVSGGQNIFPKDIETVLIDHAEIADVAVIGVPDEIWGETPIAVIVPTIGASPEPAKIVAWANDRLGKQQRLRGAQLIDELPRNANGKVLKRELRDRFS
ncbi:class I adenylate-forming enzyme family protein [Hyphobacterium sp.]|jgi:acyl-CoA synthetase (AMP-forming)/AMP-acid ligase II|uniref:class I adenylate-forming enzyme family protein n=1 Tax=Hyphobacterium sp. TaxID=2004662 RepID=UPI003BAB1AD8